MRIRSMMFGAATARLSLPGLATGRGATASFAAGANLAPPSRYVARFIESVVFAMLLGLIALHGPASAAETVTINSVTASPAPVKAGQTVTFIATMTSSQNGLNYGVLFSLIPPGAGPGTNTTQTGFTTSFKRGVPLREVYSWNVPAGTEAGTYTLNVSVSNPSGTAWVAEKNTAVTITAASAAAPADMEPPVVSGTAQVGDALASTTGTWTGATSYAYQWAGNGTKIAAATAATYTPVSGDAGHTLTSTVTATGSGGTASATSAPTVPIVAASSPSASASKGVAFTALHTYFMSPTGSDSNNGTSPAAPWATPNHAVNCGDVIIAAAGTYSRGQFGDNFGIVSNCPSTSGGIDGTGGVYFAVLLCGGPDLMSCNITTAGGGDPLDSG